MFIYNFFIKGSLTVVFGINMFANTKKLTIEKKNIKIPKNKEN